jgi:hypothetical protein
MGNRLRKQHSPFAQHIVPGWVKCIPTYFYKREKAANLLFDLVKYLLTALGATVLFTDKIISTGMIVTAAFMAVLVFVLGIFITPKKED